MARTTRSRAPGAAPALPGSPEPGHAPTAPVARPTRLLAAYVDPESGVEAVVAEVTGGYSVVVRDLDCGERLDTVRVYPTEAGARAAAEKICPGVVRELSVTSDPGGPTIGA